MDTKHCCEVPMSIVRPETAGPFFVSVSLAPVKNICIITAVHCTAYGTVLGRNSIFNSCLKKKKIDSNWNRLGIYRYKMSVKQKAE